MTAAEHEAIARFLKALQLTGRGRAMAINMLDSLHLPGIDLNWAREFLLECAETLDRRRSAATAGTDDDGWHVIEDVAQGYGTRRKTHLRHCRQQAFSASDTNELSNSVSTRSFHDHMLNDGYKDATNRVRTVLPRAPIDDPSDIDKYRKRLAKVLSRPDWRKPGAAIGKPLPDPSNCWITSDQFQPLSDGPSYKTDLATQTRDELGLSHIPNGTFLLRLSFSAANVAAMKSNENARPIFCDLGNARFRVHDPSKSAVAYAAEGWGTTFHLGKFVIQNDDNMTGRSERVSSALPLAELPALQVELLGKVGNTPGRPKNCNDGDEDFFKVLLSGRTESEIKERLAELLSSL